jgi:hypothetical protein
LSTLNPALIAGQRFNPRAASPACVARKFFASGKVAIDNARHSVTVARSE